MSPEPPLCPNCRARADPLARFCTRCGFPLAPAAGGPDVASCAKHPGVAAVRTCPRCGTFTCAECLRRGPDGTELCITCLERQTSLLPWDHRDELGTLRAFWRTSMLILKRPTETFATASPAGGVGSSLWFTLVAQLFALGSTVGLYVLLFSATFALAIGSDKRGDDTPGLAIAGGLVAAVVVGVALGLMSTIAGFFLNAGLDHLVLKMVGANPKSFEVTVRAAALSNAPALVGLVPICGPYVYFVWMYVSRVFAYRGLHRISTGQAAAGALIVPGVGFALSAMAYFVILVAALVTGQ